MPSVSECTSGSSELGYCLQPSSAGSVLRRLAAVPPSSVARASPPAAVGDSDRPRVGYLHGGVCQARLRRCRWRGGGVPPSQGRCAELDTSGCGCGARGHRCVAVAIGGAHGGSARRPNSVGQVDAVLRRERPQRRSSAREHAVAGHGRGQRQEHADDHQQLHQERLRPCAQPPLKSAVSQRPHGAARAGWQPELVATPGEIVASAPPAVPCIGRKRGLRRRRAPTRWAR